METEFLESAGLCTTELQDAFESKCIAEMDKIVEQVMGKKKYPLDGRNLVAGKRKRRKNDLGSSVSPSGETIASTSVSLPSSNLASSVEVMPNLHVPSTLWSSLYEYQRTGVLFLLSRFSQGSGGLLADEMGLGKSVQVVAFAAAVLGCVGRYIERSLDRNTLPLLLVCPATLVSHWEGEFAKWLGDSFPVVPLTGGGESVPFLPSTVYIVSYEFVRSHESIFVGKKIHFSALVLDEAQRIRNPHAKTTVAIKGINANCRIALSGSPIQNNMTELWSLFDFVAPGKLGSLLSFQEQLAEPIETGTKPRADYAQVQLSVKCAIILRELTAPLMLRRLKSEYAESLGLTKKEESVLFCQMAPEQVEVYCQFLQSAAVHNAMKSRIGKRAHQTGASMYCISVLRKIANHPDLLLSSPTDVEDFGSSSRSGKLAVLIPLLQLWARQKKRCLVFSQSLGMLDILEKILRELDLSFGRMDGSTSMDRRNELVGLFGRSIGENEEGDSENTGSTNRVYPFCLLMSTRVGGVGLNLTGADRVVIFDPDWNPMTDSQARERSWRIGQTKEVKIFRLIAAESIEEIICRRQIYKHHLAQKILVDPRQAKSVNQWDYVENFFRPPKNACAGKSTMSTQKILHEIEQNEDKIGPEETTSSTAGPPPTMSDLITKIWNQEEIEMPVLDGNVVRDHGIDYSTRTAIESVLAQSATTGPSTTDSPSTGALLSSSLSRSSALLSGIRSAVTHKPTKTVKFESTEHVIERTIVKELLSFFKKNRNASTTDQVLSHFARKIPKGGNEIFRSCLQTLCEFGDGVWTLKREHQR